MALLPAVSSCHSPACLKGKEKNLFHCSKAETLMVKILRLFSYLFCLLCFYICLFEFDHRENSQIKKKKKEKGYFEWMPFSQHVCLSSDR